MNTKTFEPMTLGNMRANGVRTLDVWYGAHGCNHHSVLDVSNYSDDVPVPAFGPRMVCTVCGAQSVPTPGPIGRNVRQLVFLAPASCEQAMADFKMGWSNPI